MWRYYNPNPVGRADGSDCAVRAVAKALDVDWETAYALIALNGFIMGDINCSDSVWGAVLRQHGFYRDNTQTDCIVGEFAEENAVGTFVVGTGSHAVAVVDGVIYDSFDSSDEPVLFVWYRKDGK